MKAIIRNTIIGLVSVFSMSASATLITDVQEYNSNTATEYFVDVDANKNNSPYYRGSSDGWGWVHNAIAGTFTSIILDISAFDVDSPSEQDDISVFDGSIWISLGNLTGRNQEWDFSQFDLSSYAWANTQVNAGLQVRMDIDSGWLVTLGKSVLNVDDGSANGGGGSTCVPTPGIPCTTTSVPEPSTLLIFSLGLIGLQARRKFFN
ncbi:PEP-CTERM sorting domain-containing protein [Thalassotalea piscium]